MNFSSLPHASLPSDLMPVYRASEKRKGVTVVGDATPVWRISLTIIASTG